MEQFRDYLRRYCYKRRTTRALSLATTEVLEQRRLLAAVLPWDISLDGHLNPYNGNLTWDDTDVSIPIEGFDLEFARHYDSLDTSDEGLGKGWRYTYGDYLSGTGTSTVTWHASDGQDLVFTSTGGVYSDPAGYYGVFSYSSSIYSYRDVDGTTTTFNSSGKLTGISDPSGNSVVVSYSGGNTTASDNNGHWLTFTFSSGHISEVEDFSSRSWTYQYTTLTSGIFLTQVNTPLTATLYSFGYYSTGTSFGMMHTASDPTEPGSCTFTYDSSDRISSITDALSDTAHVTGYSPTTYIDPLGDTWTYSYNSSGQLTERTNPYGNSLVQTWSSSLLISSVDELNHTTSYAYNSLGNITKEVYPGGNTTSYIYDTTTRHFDSLLSETDANGNTTDYYYDALGHETEMAQPTVMFNGSWVIPNIEYWYDAAGNITKECNQYGVYSFYKYDADGRKTEADQVSTSSGYEYTTSWSYDADGDVTSEKDPNGYTTHYYYDALGRETQMLQPTVMYNGSWVNPGIEYWYDAAGNITKECNQYGVYSFYKYDADGRKTEADQVSTSSGYEYTTSWSYDADGDVTSEKDPNGYTTHYYYDALGHETEMAQPTVMFNGSWVIPNIEYWYDAAGNITKECNQYGVYSFYKYDADGRKTEEDQVSTSSGYEYTTSWSYDADGDVTSEKDPNGNITSYAYDALDRKTWESLPHFSGATIIPTMTWGYDPIGDVVSEGTPQPGTITSEVTTLYFYTAMQWKYEEVDPNPATGGTTGGLTTIWGFDGLGDETEMEESGYGLATPIWQDFQYDALDRKTWATVAHFQGATAVPTMTWGYDPIGDVVSEGTPLPGTTTSEVTTLYYYTALQQKYEEIDPNPTSGATSGGPTTYWGYDGDGNVTFEIDPDGATTGYTYDTLDRKIWESLPHFSGATAIPTMTWGYDPIGDVVSEGTPLPGTITSEATTLYLYNQMLQKYEEEDPNPLTGSTSGGPTDWWSYDGDGDIVSEVTPQPGVPSSQVTTLYSYDALGDKVKEIDPNPATAGTSGGLTTVWSYDDSGDVTSTEMSGYGLATPIWQDMYYTAIGQKWWEDEPHFQGATNIPTMTWAYDGLWNVTRATTPEPGTTTSEATTLYYYDALGNKTKEIDPNPSNGTTTGGLTTNWSYDATTDVTEIGKSGGGLATAIWQDLRYDALGRQTWSSLPHFTGDTLTASEGTETYYDALGDVTTTEEIAGGSTTVWQDFSYDAMDQKTWADVPHFSQDTVIISMTWSYDGLGNVTRSTVPQPGVPSSQVTTLYSYDALGDKTEEIDPNPATAGTSGGLTTVWSYDDSGDITSTKMSGYGLATPILQDMYYTAIGQKWWEDEPHFQGATNVPTMTWAYDGLWNVTRATTPEPGTTTGEVTTLYSYDALGHKTKEIDPNPANGSTSGGPTTTWKYDALGNVTAETDANGNTTLYGYDAMGRKTLVTYPSSSYFNPTSVTWSTFAASTVYGYDAIGDLTAEWDQAGNETEYQYDALGRKTAEYDPLASNGSVGPGISVLSTIWKYDALGNIIATETPAANNGTGMVTTTYAYDAIGDKIKEADPAVSAGTPTTSYYYDADGNLTEQVDPNSNSTVYKYDALGRQIEEDKPNPSNGAASGGPTTHWGYDALGNTTQEIDADGNTLSYSYNAIGNLTREVWTGSTTLYTYDALGNVLSESNSSATDNYTYDALGRLSISTQALASGYGAPTVVLTYGYDLNGNRTSLSATEGGTADFLNTYIYNDLNQLTTMVQQEQSGGNGVEPRTIEYAYNPDGQVAFQTSYDNSTVMANTNWLLYNHDGELTEQVIYGNGGPLVGYWTFGYYSDGRISQETAPAISQLGETSSVSTTFGYNNSGWLTSAIAGTNTTSYGYDLGGNVTYNGLAYDSYNHDNEATQVGADGYLYDADGDLTKIVGTGAPPPVIYTYNWNADGQLTKAVSGGGATETFSYDPSGRRISDDSTEFFYDNQESVLEYSGSTFEARYLYGPSGNVLAQDTPAYAPQWLITDYQQSVAYVQNYYSSYAVVQQTAYASYGGFAVVTTLNSSGSGTNTTTAPYSIFGYTGKIFDATAGLEYDNARYYDPGNGHFISPDPSGTASDSNLYRYSDNDPIDRSDYTGKDSIFDEGSGNVLGGEGSGGILGGDSGGSGYATGSTGFFGSGDPGSGLLGGNSFGFSDIESGASTTPYLGSDFSIGPDPLSFDEDSPAADGLIDLGTPDQYSSTFDGYATTDSLFDDGPTEIDDLDLDNAMAGALSGSGLFSNTAMNDPLGIFSQTPQESLFPDYSDVEPTSLFDPANNSLNAIYNQSPDSAYWTAMFGDYDDMPIGQVTQSARVATTTAISRDVGIASLSLATGGLAGMAVDALEIGGGLGAILSGAASGGAASFTASVLSQATQNGGFNLSQVNPEQTAISTGIGLSTGGLLGEALYGASVFGSDAANWLSSLGGGPNGLAFAGGGASATSSGLAGVEGSVSGWLGAVGGDLTTLFSQSEGNSESGLSAPSDSDIRAVVNANNANRNDVGIGILDTQSGKIYLSPASQLADGDHASLAERLFGITDLDQASHLRGFVAGQENGTWQLQNISGLNGINDPVNLRMEPDLFQQIRETLGPKLSQ